MVRFMNGAVAERNSSVNRANVIEPLHGRREKEGKKGEEGSTVRERLPCRETRSPTLSDCIPNVVLEERVTIRIRGRQESGPTGFPLIVPDAMDDTVCRNAHGVVCPFERLRAGHVLLKGYHRDHRSIFLFVPLHLSNHRTDRVSISPDLINDVFIRDIFFWTIDGKRILRIDMISSWNLRFQKIYIYIYNKNFIFFYTKSYNYLLNKNPVQKSMQWCSLFVLVRSQGNLWR